MSDYLSGAFIVLADVGDDFTELFDIRRAFREQDLGGARIVEDGPERLVQFMRDGIRHRADGERAVHLRQLEKAPARCGFARRRRKRSNSSAEISMAWRRRTETTAMMVQRCSSQNVG
jgi:hypothetical protein